MSAKLWLDTAYRFRVYERLWRLRDLRTRFLVQATDLEQLFVWQQWHERATWRETYPDRGVTVGTTNGRPTVVRCTWVVINGHLVMFYDPTSMLVDWELVEQWRRPFHARGAGHCDARNFHNCVS